MFKKMMRLEKKETTPRLFGNEAFTMVEMMIAVMIFSLISGGIYGVLSHANKQGAKALTRQDLTTQANTLLKIVQDDLRAAASLSIGLGPAGGEVKIEQYHDTKTASIVYNWQKPRFYRKVVFDGKTTLHTFSNNLEEFSLEKKPRPTAGGEEDLDSEEQVLIKVSLKSEVPGSNQPLAHDQHAMATMRKISSFKYDPHWRDVGDMKGAFSTYGNLLGALTSDAKLLMEDVTKTLEDTIAKAEKAAEDALNQPKANLEDTKKQLRQALGDIKKGKIDMSDAINQMHQSVKDLPSKIFERELGKPGTWLGSKDKALKRVQDAFLNMKTVGDMDMSKLEKAADPFKLHSCFKDFFSNKKESLEQGVKMDENETKINDLLDKLEKKGMDGGRD